MKSLDSRLQKKIRLTAKLLSLVFIAIAFACDSDAFNNRNPYIPSYPFSTQIDMNLPEFSQLQFPSNAKYYNDGNTGVRGVIIFNTGSGYVAYDAACPNQELGSCSTMTINGIMAHCNCDDADYSLFTGQTDAPGHEYPMKPYRVSKNGSVLTIYN
jgi:nitrite reductase/ring-hydroxylating ferredoxin subunit